MSLDCFKGFFTQTRKQESTDMRFSQYVAQGLAPAELAAAAHSTDKSDVVSTDSDSEVDLANSEYYEDRELSYFKFNLRVLEQAKDENHPLLERLMFLLILSSSLDEFFEIRVSGLKKQLEFGRQRPGADGQYPKQTIKILHQQVRDALSEQYRILNDDLFHSLTSESIRFLARHEWSDALKDWTRAYCSMESSQWQVHSDLTLPTPSRDWSIRASILFCH